MDITFHGAAGEVTGSCHLVRAGKQRVLFECGLIQGNREAEARNRRPFPFDAASIDAVVLSHAHIDHSGRLPLLVKAGFRGPIFAQTATSELARIMLKDAAYLQEQDAEWENRKRERKGLTRVTPLYTMSDVETTLSQFRSVPYRTRRAILPGFTIRFQDAGHIIGSAIVEAWHGDRKLVFSGDLGQAGAPILKDPARVPEADLVVMESTYGNRRHRPMEDTITELGDVFRAANSDHGNVLMPAFSIGRSQNLLYLMGRNFDDWDLGRWQIYLDSPMAIRATGVYQRHNAEYDAEARALWSKHHRIIELPNVTFSRSADQSRRLNKRRSGQIIIAGSGMCQGGRIRHHLKHNIWRKQCHVIIAGYQAHGTTGRALVEGAERIRLWGETIRVAAKIHTVGGLSAHGDRDDLIDWYSAFDHRPRVCLVHGERTAQAELATALEGLGARVDIPMPGQRIPV